MSVCEMVSLPPRLMATRARITTSRIAAPIRMAAVGSRPRIRRDSLTVVRGDADPRSLLSLPTSVRGSLFKMSTLVVDELDDDRSGAGIDDAPGALWSGFTALDDELDEDVALSSAG